MQTNEEVLAKMNESIEKLRNEAKRSGNSPLQQRANLERTYGHYARKAMIRGLVYPIKKKYSGGY